MGGSRYGLIRTNRDSASHAGISRFMTGFKGSTIERGRALGNMNIQPKRANANGADKTLRGSASHTRKIITGLFSESRIKNEPIKW